MDVIGLAVFFTVFILSNLSIRYYLTEGGRIELRELKSTQAFVKLMRSDIQQSTLIIFRDKIPKVTYLNIPVEILVNQGDLAFILRPDGSHGAKWIKDFTQSCKNDELRTLEKKVKELRLDHHQILFTGQKHISRIGLSISGVGVRLIFIACILSIIVRIIETK